MKIESNSAEETFALGKQCGEKAAAGQVYCLYGDLGVGKTVFTKGFEMCIRDSHRPLQSM